MLMMDLRACETVTFRFSGQVPRACMWVLTVSTGNMAMCSTEPAMEPEIMNCQKRRPSWEVNGAVKSRNSAFWNFAVVASVAMDVFVFGFFFF